MIRRQPLSTFIAYPTLLRAFKSQFATITFDGAGNYSMSQQQNQAGTASSSRPTASTYALTNQRSITLDCPAVVRAHAIATGRYFVSAQDCRRLSTIAVLVEN